MHEDPGLAADIVGLRRAWLSPLAVWVAEEWADGHPRRLLDFGCGDLQLAALLPPSITVDGLDPSPRARLLAARTAAGCASPGRVVESIDALQAGSYDGIVVASVSQYLDGSAQLEAVLHRLEELLAPEGRGIVFTDLVLPDRSRLRDAADTWRFLHAQEPNLLRAVRILGAVVRQSPGRLPAMDPAGLRVAAEAVGLELREVDPNLSWLRGRRTLLATRTAAKDGQVPVASVETGSGSPGRVAGGQ